MVCEREERRERLVYCMEEEKEGHTERRRLREYTYSPHRVSLRSEGVLRRAVRCVQVHSQLLVHA